MKPKQVTLLQDYLENRLSLAETCARLGIHRTTLWKKCRKLAAEGPEGLTHKLKGRRSNRAKPEATREAVLGLWMGMTKDSPLSLYAFRRRLRHSHGLTLGYTTLRRWLKKSE